MTATRSFTFLGTGTSVGIPMLGCDCPVCTSTDPRNQRYRCSVLLRVPEGNIVIDTTPEMRLQLLRENVKRVHAVLYTHYHVDHLFGMDDLRPFPIYLGHPLPIYCGADTEQVMKRAFSYAFGEEAAQLPFGSLPRLAVHRIHDREPFTVLGETILPIPLEHSRFHVFGFRIGNVAYCTDVSRIPEASWPLLEGLDVLVIDALRLKSHPAHFSVDEALAVIERLKPQRALLTHMGHDIDHETTNRRLPAGVELAYDGLRFDF